MTGIWLFFAMMCSTSASSCEGTATRTISHPDAVSSAICCSVALMFVVGVVHIDWTLTGALPPTSTLPTLICRDLRRGARVSGTLGIPRLTAGTLSSLRWRASVRPGAAADRRVRTVVSRHEPESSPDPDDGTRPAGKTSRRDTARAAFRPDVRRRLQPDLVAAAHALELGHLSTTFVGFGFAIFAVSWAWINYSWLASAYDNEDIFFRLATLVVMIGVLVVALGIPPVFSSLEEGEHLDNTVLVTGYVIMRVATVAIWLRAARHDPEHRRTCLAYAMNISIAQVGWVALHLPRTSRSPRPWPARAS